MSAPIGTANLTLNQVELTQGEKYPIAKGMSLFMGQTVAVEAYGRAAEELAANQNSRVMATCKLIGGSSQLKLKVERIQSVDAPKISNEQIGQMKQVLFLKSKATKAQMENAISTAIAILEA